MNRMPFLVAFSAVLLTLACTSTAPTPSETLIPTSISPFPVVQIIDDNGESTGDWAMHNWVMNEKPFLYLELSCGAKDSESYHLSINGRFAYVKYPNIVLLFDTPSTSLHGRQNADGIKDAFRKCVEDLLTFYLKANFNLGEE